MPGSMPHVGNTGRVRAWGVSRLQEMRAQARPIFMRHHPEHVAALPLILLPVIDMHPTLLARDALPVGSSKLGGLPDLGDLGWPRDGEGEPLLFVAQFDLAELAPYDEDHLLPSRGLLSFFLGMGVIEQGRMDPEDWTVRYESDLSALGRKLAPKEVPTAYAVAPHALTFEAGVHPWGDVQVTQPDGSWLSLHYDQVVFDLEWQDVAGGVEPSGELYLLGSALATGPQPVAEEEGEVVLLGLPSTSGVLPFVDLGNDVAFAFLIHREALAAGDFSRVRLAYTMT